MRTDLARHWRERRQRRSNRDPLYSKLGLSAAQLKASSAALQQQIPVGRLGTPAEFASAVVYFASDESAYTAGSELVIDGGMSEI